MLGDLYYLNASLPSLMPGAPAPLSGEAFVSLCRGHLDEADFESLRHSRLWEQGASSQEAGRTHPLWCRWLAFERGLRRRLVRLRAEKLGWQDDAGIDPVSDRGDDGTTIRDAAQTAFDEANPLTAETDLAQVRWGFLDELDRASFMTLDNLIVYFLKLQLLEQQAELSREHGEQTLTDLRRIVETELPDDGLFAATAAPASASAS